jgi:mycothiol synthase
MSADVIPVVRPFTGEADLGRLVDLLEAVARHDREGLSVSVGELRLEWIESEPGWSRDCRVWEANGRFVAAVGAFTGTDDTEGRVFGEIDVHPDAREPAFVDEVTAAFIESASMLVRGSGRMLIGTRQGQQWRRSALERAGFEVTRYFFRMIRPLDEPVVVPPLPDGFAIRPVEPERELAQWVDASNRGFAGHFEHQDGTVEQKQHWMNDPGYVPEADLVLINDRGEIIGTAENGGETLTDGTERGWVHSLAIVPEYRGRGMGRALLLASLESLRKAGFDTALLSVDSENQSGAMGLYTSVGFEVGHQNVVYGRDLAVATASD